MNTATLHWLCRRSLAGDSFEDFHDRELWWMLGVLAQALGDLEARIQLDQFDSDLSKQIDRVTLVLDHVAEVLGNRLGLAVAA